MRPQYERPKIREPQVPFDELQRVVHKAAMLSGVIPAPRPFSDEDRTGGGAVFEHESTEPCCLPRRSVEEFLTPVVEGLHPFSNVAHCQDFFGRELFDFVLPVEWTQWKPFFEVSPVPMNPCFNYWIWNIVVLFRPSGTVLGKWLLIDGTPVAGSRDGVFSAS